MGESKEVTVLEQKVIRQIEYYFGDYNFPRDKFLQEQIKLDDGWIPLSTMLNFKRLASITTDVECIIEALKKSTSKLMEIDEEEKKIRRSADKPAPQMTENFHKELQSRTVYCKGFTKENATLDKLLEYFSKFGPIENVQMRSYLDKATNEYIFKGSVFVLFSKKDDAEEFLTKLPLEYEGVPLIVQKQEDYFADKKKEREEKKRSQRAKVQQANNKQPQQGNKKSQDEEGSDDEESEKGSGFAKNAVVHIKGVPNTTTWEDIKGAVEDVWREGAEEGEDGCIEVAYVDFRMGDIEGWIRFVDADTAPQLLARAKKVLSSREKSPSEDEDKEEAGEKKAEGVSKEGKEEVEKMESDEKKESGDKQSESKGEEEKEEVNGKSESGEGKVSKAEDEEMEVGKGDGASGSEEGITAKIEVCGTMAVIRALQGSEEDAYLEKVKGAREKRFMTGGKNRNRGGGRHGGNRRGRGGRGGKRKQHWDHGPSEKRRR